MADKNESIPVEKNKSSGKREDFISWDDYFMSVAFLSAQRSKDPKTQVGACIVNTDKKIVGIGYNGMPTGCSDDELPWGNSAESPIDTKYAYDFYDLRKYVHRVARPERVTKAVRMEFLQRTLATESKRLIALCCVANFVNAADRVIMPIAIVGLAKEFRYDLHQQGWIHSAFPAGYISSQIVGSCAGAQLGGKRLLLFVVFMWSLSTFLTPLVASSYYMLILTRIVLGLGEGLGLPTIYHMFAVDVPAEQRSRAFGYLAAFGSIGQVVAAAACPHFAWRFGFYIFGSLGFAWCVLWTRYYNDPGPSLPEQSLLCVKAPNPFRQWKIFFASAPLVSIYLAHFCTNWTAYVIMQWLPTYLHVTMRANPMDLSLACLPYVFNSVVSIGVGHVADRLINRHQISLSKVRKLATVVGLAGPAILLLYFASVTHLFSAVILVSLSMGFLAFNSAGHLSNHADICPKFAGITFAISNTIATLPGLFVGPLTAELIHQSSGRWWPVYVLASMINLVGAVVYAGHASTKQLL